MSDVAVQLLQGKIDCLDHLVKAGEDFLKLQQTWSLEQLEHYVAIRNQLIKKLQWIDSRFPRSISHTLEWGALVKQHAQRTRAVLDLESRVMRVVEQRKEDCLRERWAEERSRNVLRKFKSQSKTAAGEELDQTL